MNVPTPAEPPRRQGAKVKPGGHFADGPSRRGPELAWSSPAPAWRRPTLAWRSPELSWRMLYVAACLTLLAAAAAGEPGSVERPGVERLVHVILALLPIQAAGAVGLAGLALLVSGIASERIARGGQRLLAGTASAFLVGAVALIPLVLLALVLAKRGFGIGQGGLFGAFLLFFALAIGLAAAARAIGDRLAPDSSGIVRLACGLAAVVGPLLLPIGIGLPAGLVIAALGLGGVVLARSARG